MSRLVHNDYLEQASDSGVPGFLLFTVFVIGAVVFAYPPSKPIQDPLWPLSEWLSKSAQRDRTQPPQTRSKENNKQSVPDPTRELPVMFAIWLGVLGWSLQSFLEFSLYIPALAWSAFAFMGFLLGRRYLQGSALKHIDKKPASR